MGVLEHLGVAQAPAWLFAAELREGTAERLLTPYERTVPILAARPASRRLSTKVRIFIGHLKKTFALIIFLDRRGGPCRDAVQFEAQIFQIVLGHRVEEKLIDDGLDYPSCLYKAV